MFFDPETSKPLFLLLNRSREHWVKVSALLSLPLFLIAPKILCICFFIYLFFNFILKFGRARRLSLVAAVANAAIFSQRTLQMHTHTRTHSHFSCTVQNPLSTYSTTTTTTIQLMQGENMGAQWFWIKKKKIFETGNPPLQWAHVYGHVGIWEKRSFYLFYSVPFVSIHVHLFPVYSPPFFPPPSLTASFRHALHSTTKTHLFIFIIYHYLQLSFLPPSSPLLFNRTLHVCWIELVLFFL